MENQKLRVLFRASGLKEVRSLLEVLFSIISQHNIRSLFELLAVHLSNRY